MTQQDAESLELKTANNFMHNEQKAVGISSLTFFFSYFL